MKEEYEESRNEEIIKPRDLFEVNLSPEQISLENFDPLDSHKLINSWRSLKVCKATGVPISKLFHATYEELKRKAPVLKRNDERYLKLKYIETENQRQKLVNKLKELRRCEIEQSSRLLTKTTVRSNSAYGTYSIKNNSGFLFYPDQPNLDNTLIAQEKRKIEKTAAREILILMERAQQKSLGTLSDQKIRKNSKSFRTEKYNKNNHVNINNYLPKEMNAMKCLEIVECKYNKNKRAKSEMRNQRRLLGTLQDEQRKEMNEVLKRLNEYKRDKLLEKINNKCNRTENLQRQKNELIKLRQKERKDTAIRKFIIKHEIDKSMTQFKVFYKLFIGIKNES